MVDEEFVFMSDGNGISDELSEERNINLSNKDSSLGSWFFDKKKRIRAYISLQGKYLYGKEAAIQSRIDKSDATHPARSARAELTHLMSRDAVFISRLRNSTSSYVHKNSLDCWGIPIRTIRRYEERNIKALFQWQSECLCVENCKPLLGGNLVYSAPTSGGKTLVAEILMLRRLARVKGTLFFVVPFVALADEKSEYFRDLWRDMMISVKAYHGNEGGIDIPTDLDVCVCTIERANILINQLLDQKREEQLTMLVIDEIHMLCDPNRGFLLEVMLSKVRYLFGDRVQCIGMSATLPNIKSLADWMGASLFTTESRPVNLQVRVCIAGSIYKPVEPQVQSEGLHRSSTRIMKGYLFEFDRRVTNFDGIPEDTNTVLSLIRETLDIEKSVIVFCGSKELCQITSLKTADCISTLAVIPSVGVRQARRLLLHQLQQCPVGLCDVLRHTIPNGVAYHHSGLTTDERKLIENGFRLGFLTVLCATTTLAAGVNLPAHRVIIRSPRIANNDLSVTSFRQQCGRAGRLGLDSDGEAILIIRDNDPSQLRLAEKLLLGDVEPLISCLHRAEGGGLQKLLLEIICCNRLNNEMQLVSFVSCTLLSAQNTCEQVLVWTLQALRFLKDHQFLLPSSDGDLRPSQLGYATMLSGISPIDAVEILPPLQQARRHFVFKTAFHAVYLSTPPSTSIVPNWKSYEKIVDALFRDYPDIENVAMMLGVSRAELVSFEYNPPSFSCKKTKTRFYRRFYSAIILFRIINEKPLSSLSKVMSIERGLLQGLQRDSSIFCGMTSVFCNQLNWDLLGSCLESVAARLCYGTTEELIPLVRLGSEVTAVRARALFKNGYRGPLELAHHCDPNEIIKVLVDCVPHESSGVDVLNQVTTEREIRLLYEGCRGVALRIMALAKRSIMNEIALLNEDV